MYISETAARVSRYSQASSNLTRKDFGPAGADHLPGIHVEKLDATYLGQQGAERHVGLKASEGRADAGVAASRSSRSGGTSRGCAPTRRPGKFGGNWAAIAKAVDVG